MQPTGRTIYLIKITHNHSNVISYMLIDYSSNSSTDWTSIPSPNLVTRNMSIPSIDDIRKTLSSSQLYKSSITEYHISTTIESEYPELFI